MIKPLWIGYFSVVAALALGVTLVLRPEAAAAQSAASEAQAFTPPPRSIADITAILDQEKPHPEKVAALKKVADTPPPANAGDMLKFYMERGEAADNLGRQQQAVADYSAAVGLAERSQAGDPLDYILAVQRLARVQRFSGNRAAANELTAKLVAMIERSGQRQGTLYGAFQNNAVDAAQAGDFAAADEWLRRIDALHQTMSTRRNMNVINNASQVELAHGVVAMYKGNLAQAETLLRHAVAEQRRAEEGDKGRNAAPVGFRATTADFAEAYLVDVLDREGRPVEAEYEARRALLSQLQLHGRYAAGTVAAMTSLSNALVEQGRFKDAETLAHTALDTLNGLGIDPTSLTVNDARGVFAATLVAEQRWREALAQYDAIRSSLAGNPAALQNSLGRTLDLPEADLRGGRAQDALVVAQSAFANRSKLLGPDSYGTAEAEGLLAAALAATGGAAEGRRHFAHAMRILLAGQHNGGNTEDAASAGLSDQRLRFIVESYLGVLAAEKSPAASAEAFRVADAVRGRNVQRALAAAAARANVRDPALATVIRQEQDDRREAQALGAVLANAMSLASDQRDDRALADIRARITQLGGTRQKLRAEIAQRFPEYLKLVDPPPATVEQIQGVMREGEALFAAYVGEDRTYVWAVPKTGSAAFAVSSLTRADIEKSVAELRKALDPDAATLADIPAFRTDLAYKLYAGLLEPVKSGWQGAKSLLVVPHGALGQLPLALLVTADTKPPVHQGGTYFAAYKTVPWLVRQVAVTQLPSVTSLATLRATPPAPATRKPFIGFGDPWFSEKEAAEARRETGVMLASNDAGGVTTRGIKVHLRSAPKTESKLSAALATLPRLPDTREEVVEVATALKADPAHDVFLGAAANERTVRTTKLDDRRVVMFATHGLVPGDLDGLTEPALALTAPSVAHVEGDGLLTVSKILGLHLNADWVVLSACNTATGNGAGAEAVSGLGLAFFYAGSRALLVSNWPVETTAARVLTTELFRRQAASPDESRAEALRQSELALIDGNGFTDPSGKPLFSYAHPIFWAPFSLVGDGG